MPGRISGFPVQSRAHAMTDASSALTRHYAEELDAIRAQGLFKSERIITSPQSAEITLDEAARC